MDSNRELKRALCACECEDVLAEIKSRTLSLGVKAAIETRPSTGFEAPKPGAHLVCEIYIDANMLFIYSVYGVDVAGKTDMFKYYETFQRDEFVEHVCQIASDV